MRLRGRCQSAKAESEMDLERSRLPYSERRNIATVDLRSARSKALRPVYVDVALVRNTVQEGITCSADEHHRKLHEHAAPASRSRFRVSPLGGAVDETTAGESSW
jgi:hypothetical protein